MTAGEVRSAATRTRDARLERSVLLTAGTAVALVVFSLALLVPQRAGAGWDMEEGAVVAYADRVLHGAIPHRDFLTFYGPGNLWLLAGAFAVLEPSVDVERAIGLAYRLLIVLALFAVGWRLAGLLAGALAGVVATVLMAEELVWASATYGAIALAVAGVALVVLGASTVERERTLFLAAGLAGALAMVFRLDFAPAVIGSALPLLLYLDTRSRRWYAAGLSTSVLVWVPHAVVVGPERLERLVGDLRASGSGRELPIPGTDSYPGKLLVLAIAISLVLVVFGALLAWRRRAELAGPVLLSLGLLSLGLLPWVFSRADVHHIRPAAVVPLSLFPVLGLLAARRLHQMPVTRSLTTTMVVVLTGGYVLASGELELRRTEALPVIENAGRTFYDGDQRRATNITAVVAEAERRSQAGETLFVGPRDLRRFNYGPTFLYYLLPKLEPASYYMEMNPDTALRAGSGFTDELRTADWLILTDRWDLWVEPNDSAEYGSPEPSRIVRELFCERMRRGAWWLFERCDRGPE